MSSARKNLEARLRTDAKAKRCEPRPELVEGILSATRCRTVPRESSRARWRPALAAAALLLIAGGLLRKNLPDAATPPVTPDPPPVAATAQGPSLLDRALELKGSLHSVLAAEGQSLLLDLERANDAIWSGLPVPTRAFRR